MSDTSKPVYGVTTGVKIGFLLLIAGLTGWLFLGDWRIAVAGLLALLATTVAGAPTKRQTS